MDGGCQCLHDNLIGLTVRADYFRVLNNRKPFVIVGGYNGPIA